MYLKRLVTVNQIHKSMEQKSSKQKKKPSLAVNNCHQVSIYKLCLTQRLKSLMKKGSRRRTRKYLALVKRPPWNIGVLWTVTLCS